MIRIQTEYGTFEAADEKTALRLARKAKREAKKRQQRERELRQLARLRAQAAAGRVYSWLHRPEGAPRDAGVYSPSREDGPFKIAGRTLHLYTADGPVQLELAEYCTLLGVLSDGGGAVAIWTRDEDRGAIECAAIGVANGVKVWEPLYCQMDQFRQAD